MYSEAFREQDVVCYRYEPWHYRYVGRDLAKKIHDSGLTVREYLWANFTQLDSSLQPVPTATPLPSIEPSASPSPETSPEAGATAGTDGATQVPAGSPAPTTSSTSDTLFGLDPPVAFAVILLVLATIGIVATIRYLRRPRGWRRR